MELFKQICSWLLELSEKLIPINGIVQICGMQEAVITRSGRYPCDNWEVRRQRMWQREFMTVENCDRDLGICDFRDWSQTADFCDFCVCQSIISVTHLFTDLWTTQWFVPDHRWIVSDNESTVREGGLLLGEWVVRGLLDKLKLRCLQLDGLTRTNAFLDGLSESSVHKSLSTKRGAVYSQMGVDFRNVCHWDGLSTVKLDYLW